MNTALLLSGGVDSSVALHLLLQQGHTVTAFYLKIWLEDELAFLGSCPWEDDLLYVRAVCEQAGVPLRIISFQKEYREKVIAYTLAEIKAGRTPNPDILCNQYIKFGAFYDVIGSEFDYVATGHYARRVDKNNKAWLYQAPDRIKDQTYFLSRLSQEQLKRALFPLGELCKQQVRALAEKLNLPNKTRRDSQGVCFLGKLKFDEFIKYHHGELLGDLIEYETGKKRGVHKGFWFYTIGQRHSIGLSGGPWYVVKKDTLQNSIYISKTYDAQDYARNSFIIEHFNWIAEAGYDKTQPLFVKIRHAPALFLCTLSSKNDHQFTVTLEHKDKGIAAGQFAVFYQANACLGSGVII